MAFPWQKKASLYLTQIISEMYVFLYSFITKDVNVITIVAPNAPEIRLQWETQQLKEEEKRTSLK